MEKALKKYQDEVVKFGKTLAESKAEQKRLEEEIENIKVDVKSEVKKGKLTSILKRNDTDKLAKLLAEKQIIDLEVEALEEMSKQADGTVIEKAIEYVEKAQERENEVIQELKEKFAEAKAMKEKYERIMKETDMYSQSYQRQVLTAQVRGQLDGTLRKICTKEEFARLGDLKEIKSMLMRGGSNA